MWFASQKTWIILLIFFDYYTTASDGVICEDNPVGLENGLINNSQVSASSSYNNTPPEKGRLNYLGSWCASMNDTTPYLQIDLGSSHIICGVATQGNALANQWVETYTMDISMEGIRWTNYKENGIVREFQANFNPNTTVKVLLQQLAAARHVRVLPTYSHQAPCMRMELYGTSGCSSTFVGVASSSLVPNYRFTATSYYNPNYVPYKARLNGRYSWEPRTGSGNDYLQIDIGSVLAVCAIATQGNQHYTEWTTSYYIKHSVDNTIWRTYQENVINKVFSGNRDKNTIQKHLLRSITMAKFVRFYSLTHNEWPAFRVEIYGARKACTTSLGMESSTLGNNQITASSESTPPSNGRLYGLFSWCSATATRNQYLQVDLGRVKTVTGIATQGNPNSNRWIKTYSIAYSLGSPIWYAYETEKSAGNEIMIFQANEDRNGVIVAWLPYPVNARYVRVVTSSWKSAICLRMDVYGCNIVQRPSIQIFPTKINLQPTIGSHVTIQCNVTSQPNPVLQWQDVNKDMTSLSNGIAPSSGSANGITRSILRINFTSVTDTLSAYGCTRYLLPSRRVLCAKDFYCVAYYPTLKADMMAKRTSVVEVVLFLPGAPKSFKAFDVEARSASLSWTNPIPGPAEGSLVSLYLKYSNGSSINVESLQPTADYKQMIGLTPYTNYTVAVRLVSEVGEGLESEVSFTTKTALPDNPPSAITVTVLTSTSIQVAWQRPERINGPLLGYKVIYGIPGGSRFSKTVSGYETSVMLQQLLKWTIYDIEVRVYNDMGENLPGHIHRIRTKEDVPSAPPSRLTVTVINSTSVTVAWDLPPQEARNGIIRGFELRYNIKNTNSNAWLLSVPGNESLTKDVKRLKKFTGYWFWIMAYTIGMGVSSPPVFIVTAQDAPSVPRDLNASILPPGLGLGPKLNLTWKKPAEENGIIKNYTLYYRENKPFSYPQRRVLDGKDISYLLSVFGSTAYDVRLSANTVKEGQKATLNNVVVPEYKPSAAPGGLRVDNYNATSFNITWRPLTRNYSNGDVIAYEVRCSIKGRARRAATPTDLLVNTSATQAMITGLMLCTHYSLAVRAYTRMGPGPYGNELMKVTSASSAPRDLRAVSSDETTTVQLQWEAPTFYNGDLKFFLISYNGSKDYNLTFRESSSVVVPSSLVEYEVQGLTPATNYKFHITATTSCGRGPASNVVTVSTKMDVPKPPYVPAVLRQNISGTSINVTIYPVVDTNGPISSHQVIALKLDKHHNSLPDGSDSELYDYKTATEKNLPFYITAEITASNKAETFEVGDNNLYGSYQNVELKKGVVYRVYERAVSKLGKDVLLGKEVLVAEIFPLKGTNSNIGGQDLPSTSQSPGVYIVAGVIAALVIVLFGAFLYMKIRRRNESKYEEEQCLDTISIDKLCTAGGETWYEESRELALINSDPVSGEDGEEEETGVDSALKLSTEKVENPRINSGIYSEPIHIESTEIPVAQFMEFFKRAKNHQFARLKDEYKKLPAGQQCPWNAAKNYRQKNRYANIIAYDHSRVILEPISDEKGSDYINACYLRGSAGSRKKYIATQGPVVASFDDFWRMIWQERSAVIVMLTRLKEGNKVKCHQYWPGDTQVYRDIIVTNHKNEVFADYAERTFILTKRGTSERRQVIQFQFTVWPDKGVPQHATAVLGFIKKVNSQNPQGSGPIVVHCSAGVGRTGAYVVIDAMLERAEKEGKLDVFNYVKTIRRDRIHMVQTEEQYIFVHMAILDSIICGNTAVPTQHLTETMKTLSAVIPEKNVTGYADEFQRLSLFSTEIIEDEKEAAKTTQNAIKNRNSDYLPLDCARVLLSSTNEGVDYINASFADAYKERNMFIMAQAPLTHTIADFWRMMIQYKAGTIVMLNCLEEEKEEYPLYWPTQETEIYGDVVVEPLSTDNYGDFTMRRLKVTNCTEKDQRVVCHFQHTFWPDKCVPANYESVLELVNEVQRSQQHTENTPIVVQCSNGTSRSGVFCALYSVIERLKIDQIVDVFQAIKVLRTKRPKSVVSLTQYVFCYQIAQKYLDSFSDYANFTGV